LPHRRPRGLRFEAVVGIQTQACAERLVPFIAEDFDAPARDFWLPARCRLQATNEVAARHPRPHRRDRRTVPHPYRGNPTPAGRPAAELHVSVASLWEIAIKSRLDKLTISVGLDALPDLIDSMAMELMPILAGHVLAAVEPEPPTRRSFDACCWRQCQWKACDSSPSTARWSITRWRRKDPNPSSCGTPADR